MFVVKRKPLGSKGLAHFVVPVLIVVATGLVGTYLLVVSHANSQCPPGKSRVGSQCLSTLRPQDPSKTNQNAADIRTELTRQQLAERKSNAGSTQAADRAERKANQVALTNQKRKSLEADKTQGDTNTGSTGGASTATDSTPYPSPAVTTFTFSSGGASITKTIPPRGNIRVHSFVNDKDHKIGGLKVTIKRTDGDSDCLTHKSGKGETNQSKSLKRKDGTKVYGTVSFVNCKAGQYTITALGKSDKYRLVGGDTRTITLGNNETKHPKFFLQKVEATATPAATPAAGTTDNGTGGAQAP